jgi:hypothetical protein
MPALFTAIFTRTGSIGSEIKSKLRLKNPAVRPPERFLPEPDSPAGVTSWDAGLPVRLAEFSADLVRLKCSLELAGIAPIAKPDASRSAARMPQ